MNFIARLFNVLLALGKITVVRPNRLDFGKAVYERTAAGLSANAFKLKRTNLFRFGRTKRRFC